MPRQYLGRSPKACLELSRPRIHERSFLRSVKVLRRRGRCNGTVMRWTDCHWEHTPLLLYSMVIPMLMLEPRGIPIIKVHSLSIRDRAGETSLKADSVRGS